MMDYAARLAKVKARIRAKGRQITLSTLDPDSAIEGKPWRSATNPRDPENTIRTTISAVNIPLSSASSLGIRSETIELYKNTKSVFIAEPGEDTPEDFDQYHVVIDGDQESKISFIEKLKPADTTLLYYIGVES
ncbi:hypothetical protein [Nitrosomonas ureae]|nr:hypothetical protein [Nitrosomonas ureae]